MSDIIRHERKATCDIHGDYIQRGFDNPVIGSQKPIIWFSCDECAKEDKQRQEEIKKRAEYQMRIGYANIPPRYKDATLGNYDCSSENRKAFKILTDYAENCSDSYEKGRCLIVTGTVGTGKTHLAIGMAKAFAMAGYGVKYISVPSLLHEYRSCYNDGGERETDVIARYGKCGFLVLDEIGMQRGTEDEQRIIHEVIDMRYNAVLPTIVISNLAVDGIREMIGDRALDRLREGGGASVAFVGESYRKVARHD